MIPLFKVFTAPEAIHKINAVLESGYTGQGSACDQLEQKLKNHFNNPYVVLTNSCTSAIHLALHIINQPHTEVLTTPLSCFASHAPILHNNMHIKWADIDPYTCNIDLIDTQRKLSPTTKTLLVVHWGGNPVNLHEIDNIKNKYKSLYNKELHVIEDCAHCWNSTFDGTLIGNSGNFCCFSFQSIKFLSMADGGCLICPNEETYKKAKLLRWFGLDRDKGESFRCVQNIRHNGFKFQSNDVLAALGLCNYDYMDVNVQLHRDNAEFYNNNLDAEIMEHDHGSSYWLYTIKVEQRKQFIDTMAEKGIMCSPVHARCDNHSCVWQYKRFLPNMDYLQDKYVCIPVGWWINEKDRKYITETINAVL